jgi:Zn finger protein HypA/HybF involved in hydrogenase expression
MMRWQDRLTDTEDYPGKSDDVAVSSITTEILEVPDPSDSHPIGEHGDLVVQPHTGVLSTNMYLSEEESISGVQPGDIVLLRSQTEERPLHRKAVYLGFDGQKSLARTWSTKQEVEVSMRALRRVASLTEITEDEKAEAQSIRASSTFQGTDAHHGIDAQYESRESRWYIPIPSRMIAELKRRATQLGTGEVELQDYDQNLVKPILSRLLPQLDTRQSARGLFLEDILRIFYATATSNFSEEKRSSDQIRKADVERGAALLMSVLIDVAEMHSKLSPVAFEFLREEQDRMIDRANQAIKEAMGEYFKQTHEDSKDAVNSLKIDTQTFVALKRRVSDVATGQEQLPGFGDKDVRRTFVDFLQRLEQSPPIWPRLVGVFAQVFESCLLSRVIKTRKIHVDNTAKMLLKQKALLLSLLISVDAQLQSQHHGSAPRIRSRFTSLLMEERATYLLAVSKVQSESKDQSSAPEADDAADLSRDQHPSPTTSISALEHDISDISSEVVMDHSIAPHMEKSAIERPPRVMRCYHCQHVWTSTIASDLRDCPECGSYSVFAESPRRTASPDNVESPHRPRAHGEEAMGQYFSERTDKFMSLYRDKQPLPGSKQGSQESFPDPWSHLHGSHSSTSLSKASRITQEPLAADPHAAMCYSCGYRFSQPSRLALVDCPKCSSKETFIDFFPSEGSNLNQVEGTGTPQQALHEAPPQLIRIAHDIEDLAADLQKLQDRHSSVVADVPVAVEQLHSLSAAFKLLIKLQEDPDHHVRFQRVQETVQVLCSSIQYTLDVASEALHVPFNETQWMALCRRMQSNENVEFLERLRWYQKSVSGLLEHVEGHTSMGLSARDANIETLLKRQQQTLETPRSRTPPANLRPEPKSPLVTAPGSISCYSCHANISDTHKDATCPSCGSRTTAPPIPEFPLERMETQETGSTQTSQKAYISQLLSGLITDVIDATAKLHTVYEQYSDNATDTSPIEGQLTDLCESFRGLSKLYEDSRNDLKLDKVQGVVQAICHSARYTLDEILGVFDPDSDETIYESWVGLTVQMSQWEEAGLQERLQWYRIAMSGLTYDLGGDPRAVWIGQSQGANEKIAALLERQERLRNPSQPARSSATQLPAPTVVPTGLLPAARLETSNTDTESRRLYDQGLDQQMLDQESFGLFSPDSLPMPQRSKNLPESPPPSP